MFLSHFSSTSLIELDEMLLDEVKVLFEAAVRVHNQMNKVEDNGGS